MLGNAWSPSEKKAFGAVSLIYRTDNQGQGPLASTKGDDPEKNQSINNTLGWHCSPVPHRGVHVAGKPNVSLPPEGSKPAFRAT